MCGIAGFSLSPDSTLDRAQAGRVLLASVAERGADAAGCAWQQRDGRVVVLKQPGGASAFLEQWQVPRGLTQLLLHVREFTKGRPSLMANNHPIRHGSVVGVHNGQIANDERIFSLLGRDRHEPGMTVDSEAIFASLDHHECQAEALSALRGSLACCWFDERVADRVHLARGFGRPLWTGRFDDAGGGGILWASTVDALEIAEEFLRLRLHKRPLRPGSIVEIIDGTIVATRSFRPDAQARWLRNPVASPSERAACLRRLQPGIA